MNENFATKNDIQDLKNELKVLDYKLTIKLGSMLVVGLGVIATLMRT